ncbi:TetR/AcrR family transcriptional regulator [Actinomycetospora sp. CA-084318]|uniref:TetR/AcrR family transcriptional regulator n=1 Tax=Actinomycetospora sp. CA-084318 TaxID=3239892 RepID=UPI003D969D90
MPKSVDHAERRAELARAVWRVVRRAGVDGASVRATAREAGWSAGTVQHYFSTQAEMLVFAMEAISTESARRLDAIEADADLDAQAAVLAAVEFLAPLEPDARVAAELWVAFLARVVVDDRIRAVHARDAAALAGECSKLVGTLVRPVDEATVELEAARLHALLDGLTIAAVTEPERMPPERVRQVLRHHVASLVATGGGHDAAPA